MRDSHLQTRTLTDALNVAHGVLRSRGTALQSPLDRERLDASFAREPYPRFFDAWAFLADNFDVAVDALKSVAPDLAVKLVPPADSRDFTVVGNCSLDLRFAADPNGAAFVPIDLRNGQRVAGARVVCSSARVHSSGLVELPASERDAKVYFYSPPRDSAVSAAELARDVFRNRGRVASIGVTLQFPAARTSRLPEYGWVTALRSTCGLYFIRDFLSGGEALVDHNGFFARETQVVQVAYRSVPMQPPKVVIDGPFLVFFADENGVHAAAWFSWDSFNPTPTH